MTRAYRRREAHSVGVARQYCGQLGKQDNCQVAVSLSVSTDHASLPIAYQLYLPQTWADDPVRRAKAKVPAEVVFQTKPQIALDQIKAARAQGVSPGVILADAGYGADGAFRAGLSALGLAYIVGVQPTLSVWRPGEEPLAPKPWSGKGRPTSLLRRTPEHKPLSAKDLAEQMAADAWSTLTWREGTNTELASRFAAVRLRPASRDFNLTEPHPEEWLLIEWPEDEAEPTKYWLSNLGPGTSTRRPCRAGQTPLADRAGLPGAQAGAWTGPLRRPRMAGISSSRQPLHRRLWIPRQPSGDDSPLSSIPSPGPPSRWPSPGLPTPRLRQSDQSGTCRPRSLPSGGGSPSP